MNKRGKLIVIEGTDGSGKKTQTQLLIKKLKEEGRGIFTFSFPQYGKKSAGPIEEYLAGRYGKSDSVDPYVASVLYAVDRFDVSQKIQASLNKGETGILDRYTDSNIGHQGGKISDPQERAKFAEWDYNLEYAILKIPKPDLVIILRVPAELAQKLALQRGAGDGHEVDLNHLKNAEAAYLWLANRNPENHKVIDCVKNNKLLSPEEIGLKVYEMVKDVLN
ncbi:MAG: thymidylate kinase [Patescibacteria group bacterium]